MTSIQATGRAPVTPWALGGFFMFATVMSFLAGFTLLFPGTYLDAIWAVKPRDYAELRALVPWVGQALLFLSVVAGWCARGAFQRKRWGWALAVAALVVNGVADAARIPFGAIFEGLVGVSAVGAMLWWLMRPQVRRLFDR